MLSYYGLYYLLLCVHLTEYQPYGLLPFPYCSFSCMLFSWNFSSSFSFSLVLSSYLLYQVDSVQLFCLHEWALYPRTYSWSQRSRPSPNQTIKPRLLGGLESNPGIYLSFYLFCYQSFPQTRVWAFSVAILV